MTSYCTTIKAEVCSGRSDQEIILLCIPSIETALLEVQTDLLEFLTDQENSCLVLLDLPADSEFDTDDQELLLNRLNTYLVSLRCLLSG